MVNGSAPVTPTTPTTPSGVSGATAARSVLKTSSRPQNAGTASAADGAAVAKHGQSKAQAEKKKQAISSQLKKMLIQGNKRVEALATVIQHVFSEVLQLRLWPLAMKVQKIIYLCLKQILYMSTIYTLNRKQKTSCSSHVWPQGGVV